MDVRSKVSLTFGAYINKTSVSIGLTFFGSIMISA